jgi:hypothetical protein
MIILKNLPLPPWTSLLANRVSLNVLYFIGYFIYVLGCIVNFFFHHVAVNIAMCFTCKFIFLFDLLFFTIMKILVGILVVSLNTLPYQMLSQFRADPTVKINWSFFLFWIKILFFIVQK